MAELAPLGPITHLTVHCTATPEHMDVSAGTVSKWDQARFGQVSYHYLITLDGQLWNTLSEKYRGAHTGGHNTGNLGLSYVGGLDAITKQPKDTRTPAQKATMAKFIRDRLARNPNLIVQGHRDWSPDLNHDGKITPNEWVKVCPCFDTKAWIAAGMPL